MGGFKFVYLMDDHMEMEAGILSLEKDAISPARYDCGDDDDDGAAVDNNGYTLGFDPSVNTNTNTNTKENSLIASSQSQLHSQPGRGRNDNMASSNKANLQN